MQLYCRADLGSSLAKRLGHASHAATQLRVCEVIAPCEIFQNTLDASHIEFGIVYFCELFLSHLTRKASHVITAITNKVESGLSFIVWAGVE
jgi:hypothetical protein